jgi:fructose-1,6-bisphosphatase/inositol monophosphatase family enzyme
VIAVVASCMIGTDPCDDSPAVYVGFPWWAVAIATVVALALVAGLVALLVRAHRHRPWD